MRDQKLPAQVKGLSLVSFFNDIAGEMVYPLLPAFLTGTLGAGATALGALDGAAELASAVLKWFSGQLSDRPGWRKPLVLVGYATAVLVRPLMSVAAAAWQVVGFRVIDRVGKGVRTAPRDAMLAEFTPQGMEGRAFGFHAAADHLGAVLGSLVAWWAVTQGMAVRSVIGWSVVPGVLAVVVLAVVLKQGRTAVEDGKRDEKRENADPVRGGITDGDGMRDERRENADLSNAGGRVLSSLLSHSQRTAILLLALLALCRLPEALLLFRLQELGVPVATIPLLWAGLHVVRSTGSYPVGALNDRFGASALIGAGAALFAGCLMLLGKPLPVGWAVAVFLTFGLVAATTESSEKALVARLSPKKVGRGFGMYHALTGAAALPAGLFFGWIYQHGSGSDALWLSGALVGVAGIVWVVAPLAARNGVRS